MDGILGMADEAEKAGKVIHVCYHTEGDFVVPGSGIGSKDPFFWHRRRMKEEGATEEEVKKREEEQKRLARSWASKNQRAKKRLRSRIAKSVWKTG